MVKVKKKCIFLSKIESSNIVICHLECLCLYQRYAYWTNLVMFLKVDQDKDNTFFIFPCVLWSYHIQMQIMQSVDPGLPLGSSTSIKPKYFLFSILHYIYFWHVLCITISYFYNKRWNKFKLAISCFHKLSWRTYGSKLKTAYEIVNR